MHWVTTGAGLAQRHWRLVVESGPDAGRGADLAEPTILIGAAPASVLPMSDDTVSRYHAEIDVLATGLRIRDLRSTNGTYLVDRDGPVDEAFLWPGTRFRIGESWLRVEVRDEATSDGPPTQSIRLGGLVGRSAAMQVVFRRAQRLAAGHGPVLLTGPVGSGRGAIARQMHRLSPRANRPLQSLEATELLSVAWLSDPDRSPLLRAHEGTLLLRDVDRFPRSVQLFLREVLERGTCPPDDPHRMDVRFFATCGSSAGIEPTLRRHLTVAQIAVPALEARPDELVPLVQHFLNGAGWARLRIGDRTAEQLKSAAWPDQVAGLSRLVLRLPTAPGAGDAGLPALPDLRKAFLSDLLSDHGGDVTAAAKDLAIPTPQLFARCTRTASISTKPAVTPASSGS